MSIDFDNTWQALAEPGLATEYFTTSQISPIELNATRYNPVNAWWLAEFSRLIYRQEQDELGEAFDGLKRDTVLSQVGFRESRFFNGGRTQCAIFESIEQPHVAVLVFRGTDHVQDWVANFNVFPNVWEHGGIVHCGFRDELIEVWTDVLAYLNTLTIPMIYTGHSLGGALALLAASAKPPQFVYTFGAPRVGDKEFIASLKNIPVYRIVNNRDIVPTLPPITGMLEFCHVGELHYIARDGRILVSPDEDVINVDRRKSDPILGKTTSSRRWFDPYEFLSDHAPVNYVVHLSKCMAA